MPLRTIELPVSRSIIARLLDATEFGDCWIWSGGTSNFGHGRIKIGGKLYSPHRLAYRHFIGAFDECKLVCHTCDNPVCIKPTHLFVGTSSDNRRDCIAKGRSSDCRGEDKPNALLTDSKVRRIRELREQRGWGCRRIAREVGGVSPRAIQHVLDGERWTHVEVSQ